MGHDKKTLEQEMREALQEFKQLSAAVAKQMRDYADAEREHDSFLIGLATSQLGDESLAQYASRIDNWDEMTRRASHAYAVLVGLTKEYNPARERVYTLFNKLLARRIMNSGGGEDPEWMHNLLDAIPASATVEERVPGESITVGIPEEGDK